MTESVQFPETGLSLADARAAIDAARGKSFVNRSTGITARLSSSAKGKLVSNKATSKSKANGFTREQHNAMAARVGELFEIARMVESRPDRGGDANILSIKRFAVNVFFSEREAVGWITVKESKQHGHHIYSVEAIKIETLDRIVEVASGSTPHASSVPTRNMIANKDIPVNGAKLLFGIAVFIAIVVVLAWWLLWRVLTSGDV